MQVLVNYKSLSKYYIIIRQKLKYNQRLISHIKFFLTVLILIITIIIYWYFVNIWSTKWYYLRKMIKELESLEIRYDIVKMKIFDKTIKDFDYYENEVIYIN